MTTAQRPEPGTRLTFRWRKWDGSPHWEHDCVYVGSDEWGDWVGQPTGWHSHRPGRRFTAESPNVTLITHDPTWAATFYGDMHPRSVRIYIDIAWDVEWTGCEPTAIDMDLDVVRCDDERGIWIDDENEWDEHRALYDYPADVQTTLTAKAAEIRTQVTAEAAPFDDATARRWLARLAALTLDAPRLDG